jgi:hypothetical protein
MRTRIIAFGILATGLCIRGAPAQTIEVVNMIPPALSNETNQDSEPDITVNPNNPQEIVATAFTPNPTGTHTSAPVYISQDGGANWVLNNIVPSVSFGTTADITVSLSRNNVLYAGILRDDSTIDLLILRVLRSNTYTGPGLMTELLGRNDGDQPYARTYSPLGGSRHDFDHLYMGYNDQANLPRSASFQQSLDAGTAPDPAGLGTIRLERRNPYGQDGPPIRPAIHPDGTIYAAYTQRTASAGNVRTGNIVVVRDDDWGQETTPYADLTDPSDGIAGRIVAGGVNWVWNHDAVFGQERLGDQVSIALDPRDSGVVYLAWIDRPAGVTGNTATIHVRSSANRGVDWLADLLTINGGHSPQLAVNIRGDVGLLYQQLTGAAATQRWETHFRQSTNGGTTWNDFTLANTPANSPAYVGLPYLGDYVGLTAVGKDFCGVFSANNTPNNGNFPNGVIYRRNANFATHTLTSASGGAVAVSIDPFFFRARNLAEDGDFYVRDWTDSPNEHDIGLEPSTDPVFFDTSDVWNQRTNVAGGFGADDRPNSQDPQVASMGNNFAFARVHRKQAGAPQTVMLHFLKSEFGMGSNFEDANTASDPALSFAAADQVKTLISGYEWTLNTSSSAHVCLAVEIATPDDPVVQPSLLGRAPGWPATDLSVIYDNNKAQRNLGVFGVSGDGSSVTYWAVVHNAADFRRDVVLRIQPDGPFLQYFREAQIVAAGGPFKRDGARIILPRMAPCENRWVGLMVPASRALDEGVRVSVNFAEVVNNLDVNGFAIALERVPVEVGGAEGLRILGINLHRLGAIQKIKEAVEKSRNLLGVAEGGRVEPASYVEAIKSVFEPYRIWVMSSPGPGASDPFNLAARFDALRDALDSGDVEHICPRQADLDHAVDAYLTYTQKHLGDTADIAQTMRWQLHLVRSIPALRRIEGIRELADLSGEFDRGFSSRTLRVDDYPRYLERSLPVLRRIDERCGLGQRETLRQIEHSLRDARRLQKLHASFLLRLADHCDEEIRAEAPYIIRGTVVDGRDRAGDLPRPAGDRAIAVRVDATYLQKGTFEDQTGKVIAVLNAGRALQPGKSYLIHAEPVLFGKGLGVRLIKAEEDRQMGPNEVEGVAREQKDQELRSRLLEAEAVVSGSVTAIKPIQQRRTFDTEHWPDWRLAIVKVDRVLKGGVKAGEVTFLFPASRDIRWYRSTKFQGGERGIFLLKTSAEAAERQGIDAKQYFLIHPSDYQPAGRMNDVERLLR